MSGFYAPSYKMEKEKTQQQVERSDEQLLISAVMNSAWFKKQMYKAYKHGLEFDVNAAETEPSSDESLPWYDWFKKHYS